MPADEPSLPEELPPPTPELVLVRVHVEALLSVLSRKKAEKYLETVAGILASEESLSMILPFRPSEQRHSLTVARRAAMHWYRQALPTFIARVAKR